MNKSLNPYVFLFLSQSLVLLGPSIDQKTNFPAFHVVQIVKSLPFWSLKKVPLSGGASPFRPLYGIPPPGFYQVYGPSKVFSSSLPLSSAEASLCRREAGGNTINTHFFHGNIWTHNWPAPNVSGFIAQLVEHRTGNRDWRVQTPLKSWIVFRLLYAID